VRPFEQVWAEAAGQVGWFSKREAKELYTRVLEVPEEHLILEIGSYAGRATVVLAHSGRRVICIDPLEFGTRPDGKWAIGPEHVTAFEAVLARHANVSWVRARSEQAPLPDAPVGLLFIDGDHEAPGPLEDYRRFAPALAPGATACFHDYKVCPGVTEAIDVLLAEGAVERVRRRERLMVVRKR
jgi:hypothetical protein